MQASWNVSAVHFGIVNFTVYTTCTSDVSNLEHEDQRKGFFIFRDNVAPEITLVTPANNSLNTSTFRINFTFFSVDESPQTCTLTIDGLANQTNVSTPSGIDIKLSAPLRFGTHNWWVNCTDEAGNKGNSSNYTITIQIPEFSIQSQNITFYPPAPTDNASVTVNLSILNMGSAASNILVQVFRNDSVYELIRNITIDSFPSNSSKIINATFYAHKGYNNIDVIVDADNIFFESDESDNYASNSFTISAWQTYYGNASGRIEIANLLNFSVINWQTSIRNLFIIETGSSISWANLQALGTNLSNHTRIEDFSEIDFAFGITNISDSINNSFTIDGRILSNYTFIIFNRSIYNVPIINSTNSSTFITGILWDTEDGGSDFNASQDLVFVARINQSKQGSFGTYDYEIKVPGGLKDYLYSAFNTLTFYIELN